MTLPEESTVPTSTARPWSAGAEPVPGYRLVRPLGKGGMGEVWEARGPGDVPLALKRLALPGGCGAREREALDLLKHVRHPHLLSLHGYWVLDDQLVVGLELAEESLAAVLQRQQQHGAAGLPRAQVLDYLRDAAEALDYLGRPVHRVNSHTVRIQHRDVKPANLLLQGGGVKVADFGLAKALQSVLQGGSLSMTVAYAPPEFFRGETTPSSDQYALGVTYYELRTGRRPFTGTPEEVMHGHLLREPDLEGLSGPERAAVARAVAKDPGLRWASCIEFIGEIARADGDGAAAAPAAAPDPQAATATYQGQPVTSGLLLVAGELVPLPLRRTDVRAAITAACAEVTVTQVFVNAHPRAVEATYVFPLPEDAAVHRMRMQVGERWIEGEVREKEEARETYQQARAEGHGAALVEQTTPNIFTSSVANILPGQEVRVEIAYLQTLPFEEGQYRFVFPMVVAPRYVLGSDPVAQPLGVEAPAATTAPRLPQGFLRGDAVSLEVFLDAGVPLCAFDSPSHDIAVLEEDGATSVRIGLAKADEIPNRDFVLNYWVAGPRLEHALFHEPPRDGQAGTFLLITTPPAPQFSAPVPREVILVLDRSGSMQGEPLRQACQAAQQLLDRLESQDAFNLIAFSDQAATLSATPLPADEPSLRRGRAFLDQLRAGGGTEMLEPLRLALQMPEGGGRERVRTVVFLTDGQVSGERELLAALRPVIGRARFIGFGIGAAVNRHLLNKLSAAGRGFVRFLFPGENITRAVDLTLRRLGHAVLTDVELVWEGPVEEVLPEPCPDVYRNQPLVVVGRFRSEAPPALVLKGRLSGEPYVARIDSTQGRRHEGGVPLVALWARQQIEALMDGIWERPNREAVLRRQVIELAQKYRLASAYTSFLAVEYRSKTQREQACGAMHVEIPHYMPQGMAAVPPPGAARLSRAPAPVAAAPAAPASGRIESLQHKLDRVRRPRVQITYDAETGGALEKVELPFVVGVLADFSGNSSSPLPPLKDRKFIDINRDNFNEVMARMTPGLNVRVANTLADDGTEVAMQLRFERMEDFEPANVVNRVELLRKLLEARDWKALSRQLVAVLHHPDFQKLEGTWRGLHYLVHQSETGEQLKIRVLNASKHDLLKDQERPVEFDQSVIFKKLYEDEFGILGGTPYGVLVGDFEFANQAEDIALLTRMSNVAAAALCPFLAAASPAMFGLSSWQELATPRDLERTFDSDEYAKWRSFRDSEESRFVTLVLPRVLARYPYGSSWRVVEEFPFDEFEQPTKGPVQPVPSEGCVWMNAAYVLAVRITDANAKYGWCTAICGLHGGGKAEGLPWATFPNDEGGLDLKCPTEIGIRTHRQPGFGTWGFVPLCHDKDQDYAVFSGAETVHKPKKHDTPEATKNAAIAARLPYLLAVSRFAHYIIVRERDRMGAFMDTAEKEERLNRWLQNYVTTAASSDPLLKQRFPLKEARLKVQPVPGRPGHYAATAWLLPWLPTEELTAALPVVFALPRPHGG